jgi:chromosome segregation ATPase
MAENKKPTGRIAQATLTKIHEVEQGLTEKVVEIQTTVSNLTNLKEKSEGIQDRVARLEGAIATLNDQTMKVHSGMENALQVMDTQMNQVREAIGAMAQMLDSSGVTQMANSNGMENPQ